MSIDLSSGELRLLTNCQFVVIASLETPWKEALKLQDAAITTHENSGSVIRGSLVALDLPRCIGPEQADMDLGLPSEMEGSGPSRELDKEALMPRWRATTEMMLAEPSRLL